MSSLATAATSLASATNCGYSGAMEFMYIAHALLWLLFPRQEFQMERVEFQRNEHKRLFFDVPPLATWAGQLSSQVI